MSGDLVDDAALLRRIAAGDRDALTTAFDRFAPIVTRYVWAVVTTAQDAETVVENAFVDLWDRASRTSLPTGRLLPWLLTACRDRAMVVPTADGDPLRWVHDVIAGLPTVDRRLCELCLLDGSGYDDALATLGLDTRQMGGDAR